MTAHATACSPSAYTELLLGPLPCQCRCGARESHKKKRGEKKRERQGKASSEQSLKKPRAQRKPRAARLPGGGGGAFPAGLCTRQPDTDSPPLRALTLPEQRPTSSRWSKKPMVGEGGGGTAALPHAAALTDTAAASASCAAGPGGREQSAAPSAPSAAAAAAMSALQTRALLSYNFLPGPPAPFPRGPGRPGPVRGPPPAHTMPPAAETCPGTGTARPMNGAGGTMRRATRPARA